MFAYQNQFSVPHIEYALGGSCKTCSRVYLLLIVAMVLLYCDIRLYCCDIRSPSLHQNNIYIK